MERLLALGMVLTLLASSPVTAGASLADQAIAANDRLKQAIAAADATGAEPPRFSDAAWAPTMRVAFDNRAIDSLVGQDAGAALALCGAGADTVTAYYLYGFRRSGIGPNTPLDRVAALTLQLQTANHLRFQDEVALGYHFVMPCFAAGLPALQNFMMGLRPEERTDIRRDGLARLRLGVFEMYIAAIYSQGAPMRDQNRALILGPAVSTAPVYAALLPPEQRKPVLAAIDATLNSTGIGPSVRVQLEHVRKAMIETPCTAFCSF